MEKPSSIDNGLLFMRGGVAIVFIIAGFGKFSGGISGVSGFFESQGIPGFFAPLVATAELFGGIGITSGCSAQV